MNSLLDLDSEAKIFTLEPDWQSEPSRSFLFGRDVLQVNNGVASIRTNTSYNARNVEYNFNNLTRDDEYYLLDFFHDRQGRHKRFWVPLWYQAFELAEDIKNGDWVVTIVDNHFVDIAKYYERIFFKMKNGSLITRKIASQYGAYRTKFVVFSTFDQDIDIDNVLFFGLLLLVRFDQDDLELDYSSDLISECSLRFQELPQEYDLQFGGS